MSRNNNKRQKSSWSASGSESSEEEELPKKKSYEPSKNAGNPEIVSKGFYRKRDSTHFSLKPKKGQ